MPATETDRCAALPLWVDAAVLAMVLSGCAGAWCVTCVTSSCRANRERNASATLKTLSTAEADFRSNDRDDNRVNDFWTADVYGLHGYGSGIALIEPTCALADARSRRGAYPSMTPPQEGGTCLGYWYLAFGAQDDGDGSRPLGSGADVLRDRSRFAFMTFPDGLGSAPLAFLINADNTVWKHNLPATFKATVFPMSRDRNSTGTMRMGARELDDASVFPASPGAVGCSKPS